MNILVTGGAGFIGSAFVRMAIRETDWRVVNFDKLTYAGNLENLADVAGNTRYRFVRADICDAAAVASVLHEEKPDAIVHFAAESHVDRSILSPEPVIETNLRGDLHVAGSGAEGGDGTFSSCLNGRSLRQSRRSAGSNRGVPIECEQPLLGIEGRVGLAGALVFHYLQDARGDYQGV